MRDRIESRDLELVSRFRYKVEARAARRKQIQMRLAGAGLVVCLAVLALSFGFLTEPDAPEKAKYRSNPVAFTPGPGVSGPAAEPERESPLVLLPSAGREESLRQPAAVSPSETGPAPEENVQNVHRIKKAAFEKPEIIRPAVPAVKKSAESGINPSAEKNIRIAGIVSCRGVRNRTYVSPQTTFSVEDNPRLWVWMDARSKKIPRTLRHVYFMNGRRFCEIPLGIDHSHTRTWSNISLSPAHVGKWRVDVVTETGNTISRVEFDIIP